jgi:hypothetical protein
LGFERFGERGFGGVVLVVDAGVSGGRGGGTGGYLFRERQC